MRSWIKQLSLVLVLTLAVFSARSADTPYRCNGMQGYKESFGYRTFLWSPEGLTAARKDWLAGKKHPSFAALIADADDALGARIVKVTDKLRVQPGATKRHYHSLAPYWWPDPRNRKAPYRRKDGEVNPERDGSNYDLRRLEKFSQTVETLALAHYFTGKQAYADAAARWIRTWLLDPEHSMLPNFDYAQAVPGIASGRKEGVIDARWLMSVAESIGLIEESGALSKEERIALREWFAKLVQWLAQSELGRAERAANNNHGIFYDLQLVHFSLFSGHKDVAKLFVQQFPERRLVKQMAADGSLPEELTRTRSFHYSSWTLGAIFDVASLSACVSETSLWSTPASQASAQRGLNFMRPFLDKKRRWTWPERDRDDEDLHHTMLRAAFALKDDTLWQELEAPLARSSKRYQLWLYR